MIQRFHDTSAFVSLFFDCFTKKTGVPVNAKLPAFVIEALNTTPKVSQEYFFWTGEGKRDTAAGNWRR